MRMILAATAGSLMLIGLSQAGNAAAAIKQPTHIPPEALDRALQSFAKERNLVLAYRSEVVGNARTAGASGVLTREQALTELLRGTGLTYRFLDENTITIVPLSQPTGGAVPEHLPSGASSSSSSTTGEKEGKKSSSGRFHLSELDRSQAGSAAPVTASAGDASQPPQLEEIVVTAEMRHQRLLDVPASITVITGNDIAKTGAATIEDLQYEAPGLSIAEFSPGQQRIEIDGISAYEGLPTVGVYLDEMPLNMNFAGSGMDVRLLDMQRVEVLRGPQGTLYGQGSLGGTIRYITNQPDLNSFGGSFGSEGAAIDGGGIDWRTDGVLNLPIVPGQFGVRLAAEYQNFGGWIDETLLNIPRANTGKDYTVRASGLWVPIDPLSISLMVQHQVFQVNDQNLAAADDTAQDFIIQPNRERVDLGNLTAKYDFGGAQLLSSTGWLDRSEYTQDDDSAAYIPYLEAPPPTGLGLPPGSIQSVAYDFTTQDHILTEELRLSTEGSGPLGGTVGVFYRDSHTRSLQSEPVIPDIVDVDVFSGDGTNPENSRSWAIFGQGHYRLTSTLEATLGLRYFQDRQQQAVTSTSFGYTTYDAGTQTFSSTSPRIDLSWHVSDNVNLYTSLAKGFRSGGFNLTSESGGLFPIPQTYAPETLWTYELGSKFQSDSGRVASDVSVYHNDWKNVQSLAFPTGLPLVYTVNGGTITGWGVNAQLTVRPVESLELGLTGGWNDMTYVSTTADHLPGDPPDYVPRYTASAFAEYRYHWTPRLPAFVRVDYQRSDRFQVYLRNYMTAPAFSDVLNYVNASAGVNVAGWTVSLLAKNITNENGVLYPELAGTTNPVRPEPRTIGASVSTTF
jgi:iron complex outermembrane recepter protein